ncbi:MAG: ATP-binding protein [Candidatus Pacebacteria bacterium]|nr:ATP-binding protein [Candidatus Paceibacterota bacterium]
MRIPFLDKLLGKKEEDVLPRTQTVGLLDIIAPPALKFGPDHTEIGKTLARTYFIFSFPRYLSTGWLSPIINLDVPMNISIFMHPIDTGLVLKKLRKKLTEVQSEIMEREERGLIRDPVLETAYRDIETLRDRLQTAEERMFRVGLYITIYAETKKELDKIEGILRSLLESKLVYIKPALYQQDKGFTSTSPYCVDRLMVHTPMNTGPLSTMFPFVSFDLSSNEGILYGINQHNNSLVLFDRFTLENANMVVFGKSGGGKSIMPWEPVIIKDRGTIKMVKIGDLVERLIKKYGCKKIDPELEGVVNPKIEVFSFNKNLRSSWSKVTIAARKKAPRVLYKFRTRSGREITTTGDHNMLVLKNGKIIVTKSSEVKRGDFVPLPRKITFPKQVRFSGLKSVPDNCNKQNLAHFLKNYFEKYAKIKDNEISLLLSSKDLISEIAYLLYCFGIVVRIQKKKKEAALQNRKRKKTYWQLTISGKESLEVFKNEIGFLTEKKNKQLGKIIKKKGNTNVDVIPEIASLCKTLSSICPFLTKGVAEILPQKRGVFYPSRGHLRKIIKILEKRLEVLKTPSTLATFSNSHKYYSQTFYQKEVFDYAKTIISILKTLANSDLFFDEIVEIKKIEGKKTKYVYDLTVENEVFLAGFGGMFVHNSYVVKLEILRYLMLGVDVIVIDPENEYRFLCDAVDGAFYDISLKSPSHINPFDLPLPAEDETPEDVFRSNIINLVGLMRVMLGGLTPEEDALIDQAITETYAARDITPETDPSLWKERIPLLSDLEAVLETMEGAESLTRKLRKFTKGVYAGFFNYPTNVTMDKQMVVFGIRNLETELRPLAMYIIMRYIWNTVKKEMKKRILVIDEAWWLMQSEDSASFLFGIVKRGRKYWIGVTTITQDVNDFMKSEYGQPIITNSSLQLLMKQSPAAIDVVQKTFNLTDEEKYLLLESPIGEGIFFAGEKHVAIRVVSSYVEHQLITTAPEEIVKIKQMKKLKEA